MGKKGPKKQASVVINWNQERVRRGLAPFYYRKLSPALATFDRLANNALAAPMEPQLGQPMSTADFLRDLFSGDGNTHFGGEHSGNLPLDEPVPFSAPVIPLGMVGRPIDQRFVTGAAGVLSKTLRTVACEIHENMAPEFQWPMLAIVEPLSGNEEPEMKPGDFVIGLVNGVRVHLAQRVERGWIIYGIESDGENALPGEEPPYYCQDFLPDGKGTILVLGVVTEFRVDTLYPDHH